jgi:hypothetical protein
MLEKTQMCHVKHQMLIIFKSLHFKTKRKNYQKRKSLGGNLVNICQQKGGKLKYHRK